MSIESTIHSGIVDGVTESVMVVGGSIGKMDVPDAGRIDTHHHFFPPIYVETVGAEAIASITPDHVTPKWTAAHAIEILDRYKIDKAILSISSGDRLTDPKVIDKLAAQCNEYAAKLKLEYPGRFGSFASLPLPDVPATLRAIEYAQDQLGAEGFIVFTNYGGRYLGDAAFTEVLEELDRRKAVVFIHPFSPPYKLEGQPADSVVEFTFETTRTAISLIFSGASQRFRDIRFILSHAGGTIPFLAPRIAGAAMMNPELRERIPDVVGELKRFYYDTALTASPDSLSLLLAVADHDRIVFGTDQPFSPEIAIPMGIAGLSKTEMEDDVRLKIYRGNALELFPGSGASSTQTAFKPGADDVATPA